MLIDTEQAKRRLVESGVSEEQASAHLDVLRMIDAQTRDTLATKEDVQGLKQDIEVLRSELQQEIETLRSELQQEIGTLRSERKDELRTMQNTMYCTMAIGVAFLSMLIAVFRFL